MTSLSIVIPTAGRDSLPPLVHGLLGQAESRDEIIIVGDGPQPRMRKAMSGLDPRVRYFEFGPSRCGGYPQRNAGMGVCAGEYILSLNEDDKPDASMLSIVKRAVEETPGRPLIFRIEHPNKIMWCFREMKPRNVTSSMFVVPNVPERLGRWGRHVDGDYDFIKSTIERYPQGASAIVWRREITVHQGTEPGSVTS